MNTLSYKTVTDYIIVSGIGAITGAAIGAYVGVFFGAIGFIYAYFTGIDFIGMIVYAVSSWLLAAIVCMILGAIIAPLWGYFR